MKTTKKITKSGNSLSVTIPSMWAKSMGIEKGSKVELEWDDAGEIIIRKVKK